MSSLEAVINSYDAGQQPYIHDPKRGKWTSRWDFNFTCIGQAFGIRNLLIFVTFMQLPGGGYVIIPAIVSALLYVIPICFVQSFMGQFSSTGYITVFRISPLFKGIGYVILALNFSSLTYFSAIASHPLLLFLKSFQLNTTWMYCNNEWNNVTCEEKYYHDNASDSLEPQYEYYFYEVLKLSDTEEFGISWTAILAQMLIWILVCLVIVCGISMVGKVIRYSTFICLVTSTILFIRVMCLPDAFADLSNFFEIANLARVLHPIPWITGPLIVTAIFGKGWGNILTMASFQPFKENTERYTYVATISTLAITFYLGILMTPIIHFIERKTHVSLLFVENDNVEHVFFSLTYFFGKLEASQMWSMIFFLIIFLGEFNALIVEMFAMITSICDEFVRLRELKREAAIGLCTICFLISTIFASERFIDSYKYLISVAYTSQMSICFLEIIVVVWIYGREQFLRDVRFMLVRNIAAWKFYIIRFITPIFILFALLICILTSYMAMTEETLYTTIFVLLIKGLPWIFIPGYIIATLWLTIGSPKERFRKCTRPNDWYPADPKDKQRYELALGSSDISQQLLEMNDESDL